MKGLTPKEQEEFDYVTKQAGKVLKTLVVIVLIILTFMTCG